MIIVLFASENIATIEMTSWYSVLLYANIVFVNSGFIISFLT